nr:uncharacterized protein LOC120972810 [Aegilops tauschii subsp. strangulata]
MQQLLPHELPLGDEPSPSSSYTRTKISPAALTPAPRRFRPPPHASHGWTPPSAPTRVSAPPAAAGALRSPLLPYPPTPSPRFFTTALWRSTGKTWLQVTAQLHGAHRRDGFVINSTLWRVMLGTTTLVSSADPRQGGGFSMRRRRCMRMRGRPTSQTSGLSLFHRGHHHREEERSLL